MDSNAKVTWKVVDPTAASISASGNTATVTAVVNPGFTQVVATSGEFTANASVGIAAPAAHTHVLDHSLILSTSSVSATSAQLALQSTSETTAIKVGDYIVSQGVLAKVAAVHVGNNQVTLSVEPASLSDAFTSFKFSAQGMAPQSQMATKSYTARLSPQGVLVQPRAPQGVLVTQQSKTIPWDQVQCKQNGNAANFQLTQGSVAFDGLTPTPTFNVTKDPTTGVEAFTAEVSAQPTVTITSPTLTFSPSLTGSIDCKVSLQKVQLPAASFYGIISLDFDVTPVIGFTASATLSAAGSASFTGPQLKASTQYDVGFKWSTVSAPTAINTVSPPKTTFTPFTVSADNSPSLNLDFEPYAAAQIGMDIGVHVLFINVDAAGLDFSKPKIGLNTQLGLSSLPSAYTQSLSGYQGPSWSANLDGNADFGLHTTGALQSVLQIMGFHDSISLGSIKFLNIPISGSPQFALSGSDATVNVGAPVTFTVTQSTSNNVLFPENVASDEVQFWETGSSNSPSLLGTTTLSSSGTASYDWASSASQAGNDTITALIYGLLGDISLPYASSSVDVTVSATNTGNPTISASLSSIPADGATASTLTVQLYDANGHKLTTGGDTILIASTLGTVSPVTDNNNGTYTAQLTSSVVGTAVLSFTVNGVASASTTSVSVTQLASSVTVSTTTPADGANGVSISSGVSAIFSGAVDASTLNTSTFTLTGPDGLVAGTVSYDATTNTATYMPLAALAYSATYSATITTGVKDPVGNPLASNYTWSFTTAAAVTGVAHHFAYVTNFSSDNVSQYTIGSDGSLTPMSIPTVAAGVKPISVTVDPGGKYAYVTNQGSSNVSQYTIGTDGSLTPMSIPTVTTGSGPAIVTVDPSGKYAYVTNEGGNSVSQYMIGSDGSLTPMSIPTVAAGSLPFSVTVDPSGKYAYVANSGSDSVSQYTIGSDGSLTPMSTPMVVVGGNPANIAIDPSGKYAYVANSAIWSVSQYTIGSDGSLMPMSIPTVATGIASTSVTVDPSGKYAYVTNNNGISQYTIGSDGGLSPMSTSSVVAGTGSKIVTVDPSGKYAYVTNFVDGNVSQYTIGSDGSLTPMSSPTVAAGVNPWSIVTIYKATNLLTNGLVNGGFENGLQGWQISGNAAIRTSDPPAHGGSNYVFGAGNTPVYSVWQDIDLINAGVSAIQIDNGSLAIEYGGWQSGWHTQRDYGQISIYMFDAAMNEIGSASLPTFYSNNTWVEQSGTTNLTAGTRFVRFEFTGTRVDGSNDDGYLDDAYLNVKLR